MQVAVSIDTLQAVLPLATGVWGCPDRQLGATRRNIGNTDARHVTAT